MVVISLFACVSYKHIETRIGSSAETSTLFIGIDSAEGGSFFLSEESLLFLSFIYVPEGNVFHTNGITFDFALLLGEGKIHDLIWSSLISHDNISARHFPNSNIMVVVVISSHNMATIRGDGNSSNTSLILGQGTSIDFLTGGGIPSEERCVLTDLTGSSDVSSARNVNFQTHDIVVVRVSSAGNLL